MEAGLLWWWSLDNIHLRVGLTHSFVPNSGDDFYFHWWDKLIICNYIYSDFHSFVVNGFKNYCIELWLTLGVTLVKLLWKFLILVLVMNYLDWFVKKKKKYKGTFELYFSCFEPFWIWSVTICINALFSLESKSCSSI